MPFKFPLVIRYSEKPMPKWKSNAKLGVTPWYILASELTSEECGSTQLAQSHLVDFPRVGISRLITGCMIDGGRRVMKRRSRMSSSAHKAYMSLHSSDWGCCRQYWPSVLIHPNFDHDNSVLVVCLNSRGNDPPKDQLDDLIAAVRDVAHIHPDPGQASCVALAS